MKCIKDVQSGLIFRTKDQKAANLVKDGTHKYVSKSEWKDITRKVEVSNTEVLSTKNLKSKKKKD